MSIKHQVSNLKNLTEKGNDLFHNYLPNHACQTQIYKVLVTTTSSQKSHEKSIALSRITTNLAFQRQIQNFPNLTGETVTLLMIHQQNLSTHLKKTFQCFQSYVYYNKFFCECTYLHFSLTMIYCLSSGKQVSLFIRSNKEYIIEV